MPQGEIDRESEINSKEEDDLLNSIVDGLELD
jgi:hypothetical protein